MILQPGGSGSSSATKDANLLCVAVNPEVQEAAAAALAACSRLRFPAGRVRASVCKGSPCCMAHSLGDESARPSSDSVRVSTCKEPEVALSTGVSTCKLCGPARKRNLVHANVADAAPWNRRMIDAV